MGEAANQITKLPPVPAREYGTLRVGRLTDFQKYYAAWDQAGYEPMFGNSRIQVLRQVEQNIHEPETDRFRVMKSVKQLLILFCLG